MNILDSLQTFFVKIFPTGDDDVKDPDIPQDVAKSFTDTKADIIKDFIIEASSIVVPIAMVLALISSNGYFFSGFHTFTLTDFNVALQWTVGGVIELGTAGLMFSAARSRKKKNPGWWKPLIWVLVLMTISFVAQYMYLRAEWESGAMTISDHAVSNIPLFGWLVGVGGIDAHGVFFTLRSLAMHLVEIAATFALVPRGTSIEKLLERQRKIHEYKAAQATQKMSLGLQEAVQKTMEAVLAEQTALITARGKQLLNGATDVEAQPDFPKALMEKAGKASQQSKKNQADISLSETGPLPTIQK